MKTFILCFALVLGACNSVPLEQPPTRARIADSTLPPMKAFSTSQPRIPAVSNANIATDFLSLHFELESGRALPTFTRFETPVSVRVTGSPSPHLQADLRKLLTRLRSEAGIDIQQVSSGNANITIEAVSRAEIRKALPEAACFVVPNVSSLAEFRRDRRKPKTNWSLLRERERLGIFVPSDASPQEVRDCLHEELAQALGPLNDLYRLPQSVFNDDNVHTVLTGFDMLILRAAYAPELQSGMTREQVAARLPAILDRLNCGFTPQTRVGSLSIANKQMVEIARALTVEAKAVIFDEPTASLTDAEKVVLFDIINGLRDQGVGIVYISHRMDEIFTISDRISVLRDGAYRGSLITADTNEDEVTRLMIGRSLDLSHNLDPVEVGEVVLEAQGLSCGSLFQDVSFRVHSGEVVGFYGLVGAGRTEIAETLFGLRTASAGSIRILGEEVRINSPMDAITHGISLVPEDRKEQGLVLGMSCRDNMTLPQVGALTRGPFVDGSKEMAIFDTYHDKLEIKTPSWKQQAGNLSGGNQQKIVIGKWLSMQPKLLIVDEPTRGIDVGSKSEIHNLIRDLASQGYAVIVISSEMPEVLRVSDRVIAMFHGRIMREFTAQEVTEDSLVQAISGISPEKVA